MNIGKLVFSAIFTFLLFYGNTTEPKSGFWQGTLSLNETTSLPFLFSINEKENLIIYNAEEQIELASGKLKRDSMLYSFIAFKTYLIFHIENKKNLVGYYVYPDRKKNARIPFSAEYIGKDKPNCKKEFITNISGKWKTTFGPNTDGAYPAIGKFKQQENGRVTGTFLTETGDYRFLDGYLSGNQLTLSCFDGSHAFLFKAEVDDNKINGTFHSGSHWQTNWTAERNENFRLKDPDSLTYLIKDDFTFVHPDTTNTNVVFPNVETQGKVVIIQIIGTWCPNCLDETNFYKELYAEYHEDGLEIIGVAYEYPETKEEQIDRIKRYSVNKNIPYPILVGGHASKNEASSDFNMLNEISSFPTSIFINRQGQVVKVHTGFNGPGTGKIYEEYIQETKGLIKKLIRE